MANGAGARLAPPSRFVRYAGPPKVRLTDCSRSARPPACVDGPRPRRWGRAVRYGESTFRAPDMSSPLPVREGRDFVANAPPADRAGAGSGRKFPHRPMLSVAALVAYQHQCPKNALSRPLWPLRSRGGLRHSHLRVRSVRLHLPCSLAGEAPAAQRDGPRNPSANRRNVEDKNA